MFYLLPAITSCNWSCSQSDLPFESVHTRRWTHLEVVGFALDILLVASLCIAISLAISVHFGIQLGPFNGISVLSMPLIVSLATAAGVILLIDMAKLLSNLSATPERKEGPEQPEEQPDPTLTQVSRGGRLFSYRPVPLPVANPPHVKTDPNRPESIALAPIISKPPADENKNQARLVGSYFLDRPFIPPFIPSFSSIEPALPFHPDEPEVFPPSIAEKPMLRLPLLEKHVYLRASEPALTHLPEEPVTWVTLFEQPNPLPELERLAPLAALPEKEPQEPLQAVAEVVHPGPPSPPLSPRAKIPLLDLAPNQGENEVDGFTVMNDFSPEKQPAGWMQFFSTALNWLKDWFKPGLFQMRFYTLHTNFMIEQLLSYNEEKHEFEEVAIPISYKGKLKKLQEKKFSDHHIQEFSNKILNLVHANAGHPFTTRYSILDEIEKAFETCHNKSNQFEHFLQSFCYQLYTQFDALTYGDEIVHRLLTPKNVTFTTLADVIEADQKEIKALPKEEKEKWLGSDWRDMFSRLRGAAGVAFYPMMINNFACRLWRVTYSNGHTVQEIRFGSPTNQAVISAEVLGQMRLFVKACESKGETFLSFQLQSFKGEKPRLQAMFDLAKEHPKAFFCINLDMDSKFYHQTRPGMDIGETGEAKEIAYEDFKEQLLHRMKYKLKMSDNTREAIDQIDSYGHDLAEMADEVLQKYFPDVQEGRMTAEQRKDFIFLYYLRYRRYMNLRLNPTYSGPQCKDTMDRSMSEEAADYLMTAIELNQHQTPQFLESFRTIVSFVGMIVKGSAMDGERFDRFLTVVRRLIAYAKPDETTTVVSQTLDAPFYNSRYNPFPCDAQDADDYLKSDLLETKGNYIPVIPVDESYSLPDVINGLYNNSDLNFNVDFPEKNKFTVSQGDKENILAKGRFKVVNGQLSVKTLLTG